MSVPAENLPDSSGDLRATIRQAAESVDAEKTQPPRDESGKFVASKPAEPPLQDVEDELEDTGLETEQPQSQETQTVEAQQDAPADQAPVDVPPPASWKGKAKLVWNNVPPEAREEILRLEKERRETISRQDEDRVFGKNLREVIKPYIPTIQAEGGTPEQAVNNLLQTAWTLRNSNPDERARMFAQLTSEYETNPYHLIYYLAEASKVDLGQLAKLMTDARGQPAPQEQPQQPAFDPQMLGQHLQPVLKPLIDEVSQIKNAWQSREQHERQLQTNQARAIVQEFETEAQKGANGKYPFYTDVRDVMRHYLSTGQAASMEDAYEKACWQDKDIRASLLQMHTENEARDRLAKQKAEADKRKAEAAEKAKRARTAGLSINGAPGATPSAQSQADDIRASLLEGFKSHGLM